MGRAARVTSIDILQTIAVAFKKFSGESSSAMDDLDIELHRALEWIQHDRKEFWNGELRRRQDRVAEARVQLMQAQTSRRVGDYRPSCVDEQKALEKAKRRLATAEHKVVTVRQCAAAIERAVNDCQRARNQFTSWLDSDVDKAITALNRMSDSLDNYVSLTAPAGQAASMTLPEGLHDASSEFLSAKSATEPETASKTDAAGENAAETPIPAETAAKEGGETVPGAEAEKEEPQS